MDVGSKAPAADRGTGFIPETITRDQAKDTGMAFVLICLIVAMVWDRHGFFTAAVVLLLVNMVVPTVFTYPAKAWLGLSHLLGTVMSKVLLTLVFFFVVTPMGLLRRVMGKDTLALKKFKSGSESAMVERNHQYAAEDVEQLF